MKSNSKTARFVGALFLIAIVVSIMGGVIIDSILSVPDYLSGIGANRTQLVLGVLMELINGLAVVGIAVFMYPLFRRHNEALALGYVALRIIEAVIVVAAVISPVALLAVGQSVVPSGADASSLYAVGSGFLAVRTFLVGQMTGIFFCLAAVVFFSLLYQTQLLPRFIAVWGLIGVILVLIWNLLELFGIRISFGMVLALPMILNEVFLAIWLIAKGFNPEAVAALSASSAPSEMA